MKKKWFLSLIILVAASLVISFLYLARQMPEDYAAAGWQTPSAVFTEKVPETGSELTTIFEETLHQSALDSLLRKSIEEKLEMAKRAEQTYANIEDVHEIQSPDTLSAPLEQDDPTFIAGIFEGDEGLFTTDKARIENYWQGKVNDKYIQIFAGASAADLEQGIVIVVVTSMDRLSTTFENYYPQKNIGPFRVVDENEMRLILSGTDGQIVFDIFEMNFVE